MTATPSEFWTAALPAFLATLVEFVEALTIVLAVGTTRGWRPALLGAAAATLLLAVAVVVFGAALARVPEREFQLVVGVLLVLFGMRWLRTASLRAAGVVAMRDEALHYERTTRLLATDDDPARRQAREWGAFAASFNGVAVEGLEVVFIIIAIAPTARSLRAAIAGAAAALAVVVALGIWLHRPLQRLPENALKLAVGAMLSALGTYWAGESFGLRWPGGELAIVGLIAGYLIASALAAAAARAVAKSAHAKADA